MVEAAASGHAGVTMKLVNTALASNPLNWVIVFLMLAIAGIGGHYLMAFWQSNTTTPLA